MVATLYDLFERSLVRWIPISFDEKGRCGSFESAFTIRHTPRVEIRQSCVRECACFCFLLVSKSSANGWDWPAGMIIVGMTTFDCGFYLVIDFK